MYEEIVKKIAEIGVANDAPLDGDYIDGEGLLVCGKCHTRKRSKITFLDKETIVAVPCKCQAEAQKKAEEDFRRKERFDKAAELTRHSFIGERFRGVSFESSSRKGNERQLKMCRRYADKFDDLFEKNQGLLLYGDCGTGKSHAAACICNQLMSNLHPVYATSFVKLLDDKADIHGIEEMMQKADLVLFDDLGAERDTGYAQELVYNLIDARYKQQKPMIVTTNLRLADMKNVADFRYKRIYQRILECCYPIYFDGKPIRLEEAANRYDEMTALLGG